MNLRCIAIDDEPLALQQMQSYIEKTPFLEGLAYCPDTLEALEKIHELNPDLLFVDINMPGLSGIELVRSLVKEEMVVFTTAYGEHALEGFRVNAVDYLLKPISYSDFLKSANRAKTLFDLKPVPLESISGTKDSLFVKSEHRMIRIRFSEIRYIEGMREYVRIHLSTGKPIMTLLSMKLLEEKLPENKFMRVHRSFIVNLDKINIVERNRIVFDEAVYIPIGDIYRESFQEYIDKHF